MQVVVFPPFSGRRSRRRRDGGKGKEEGGNILHDNTYICLPFCSLSSGSFFVAECCRGNRRLEVRGGGGGAVEGRLVTQTPL